MLQQNYNVYLRLPSDFPRPSEPVGKSRAIRDFNCIQKHFQLKISRWIVNYYCYSRLPQPPPLQLLQAQYLRRNARS